MAESLPGGLILATQVARETEVRRSANGVRFATFGETGVADLDLDRMLEAVPAAVAGALKSNTYYFVPLAMREPPEPAETTTASRKADQPLVARRYDDEFSDSAICHRNVELGHGHRGVFISTRLMGDRFALCFEFFINVAHAFVDQAGVPQAFADLAWQQAVAGVRGETSLDAWESRNLSLGRPLNAEPLAEQPRRNRTPASPGRAFSTGVPSITPSSEVVDEREKTLFLESSFSDTVAVYLLSLALDFDYAELREREYPLLAPAALAARLKLIAELFPPNPGYEFAVKYRRRA
jgi:hypothetical protein